MGYRNWTQSISLGGKLFYLMMHVTSPFPLTFIWLFCVCVQDRLQGHRFYGQRTNRGSWFSPFTMWVPGLELGSSGWEANSPFYPLNCSFHSNENTKTILLWSYSGYIARWREIGSKSCAVVCILVFTEEIRVKICKQLSVHGQLDGWKNKIKYIVIHIWVYFHIVRGKFNCKKGKKFFSMWSHGCSRRTYPK